MEKDKIKKINKKRFFINNLLYNFIGCMCWCCIEKHDVDFKFLESAKSKNF